MNPLPGSTFLARLVMQNELRALVRDRRAMFSAFVLPFLIYPLFLLAQSKLNEATRDSLDDKDVSFALTFHEGTIDLGDEQWPLSRVEEMFAALLPVEGPCSIERIPVDPESNGAWSSESWEADEANTERLLVRAANTESGRVLFEFFFTGSDDLANEAKRRARAAFDSLRDELEAKRLSALIDENPADALEFEAVDIASTEDQSGAALGRLLPLLLVLSILAGGSMAALAAFAGERENGTLETLLVQPAPASSLAWGKFAVVALTALGTLLANGASLLMCAAIGIESEYFPEGTLSPERLALGLLLFMPALLLLCAALTYVSSRARTFREGQQLLMPLTLVAALPSAAALLPSAEFGAVAAVVPIAGPALGLRDALTGNLNLGVALWMFLINSVWAAIVLRGIGNVLEAERLLRSVGNSLEAATRRLRARAGLRWGFLGVFLVYVVGGALQSRDLLSGLILTLWVLLPILTWACARPLARERGWVAALGLHRPNWSALLGAVLAAPGLAWLASHHLLPLQESVLPMPKSVFETVDMSVLENLPAPLLFFLIAITPGICEELFFRGAVLQSLKRDLSALKVVGYQALLFGLVHASVYRFATTAILGAILAAVTLRTRTLWPAIVLHTVYNGSSLITGWIEDGTLPLGEIQMSESQARFGAIALTLVGGFLLWRGVSPSRREAA